MHRLKKAAALVLAMALCVSLAGCKKKKEIIPDIPAVSADDEWYNAGHYVLETNYEKLESLSLTVLAGYDQGTVGLAYGVYKSGASDISEFIDLVIFDPDGSARTTRNISKDNDKQVVSYQKKGDILSIYINSGSGLSSDSCEIEIMQVQTSDMRIIGQEKWDTYAFRIDGKTAYETDMKQLPDGRIVSCAMAMNRGEVTDRQVLVRKDGQVQSAFEMFEYEDLDVDSQGNIWLFSHQTEIVSGVMLHYEKMATMNPDTGEIKEVGQGPHTRMDYSDYSFIDGKMYVVEASGLQQFDLSSSAEKEQIIDFGHAYVDRLAMTSLRLSYIDGQTYCFTGKYQHGEHDVNRHDIVFLSKAEKNPNAGEKILIVGVLDGNIDPVLSRTLEVFNAMKHTYFAEVRLYDKIETPLSMSDEEFMDQVKRRQEVMEDLREEIESGEGPDVIWNASSWSELDGSGLLMDMTGFLNDKDNGVNPNQYFLNIIRNNFIGNKVYQIPLAFELYGIRITPDTIPESLRGFTYDEYADMVESSLSGTDPLLRGKTRLQVFAELLSGMMESMIDREKKETDFDNKAFRALAEYCKENYPSSGDGGLDPYEAYIETSSQSLEKFRLAQEVLADPDKPGYLILSSPLDAIYMNDLPLFGISPKGDGPYARVTSSAAVSALSVKQDGGWAFIHTALTAQSQDILADDRPVRQMFPVNHVAMSEYMDGRILDDYVEYTILQTTDPEQAEKMHPITEEGYSAVLVSIDHCGFNSRYDSRILEIVLDEMIKYFNDDCSLDKAISKIDERAKNVLNEGT